MHISASRAPMTPVDMCHCLAVRKAARWISQLYDRQLAPAGITSSQFAVLSQLDHQGTAGIVELADSLVMDRTTMTRTIAPLERAGFVAVKSDESDRRRKVLTLTREGRKRLTTARPLWRRAQAAFEEHFGAQQALAMRELLRDVPTGLTG
jgi:DNA-binding MarR family transcriptional regulator